MDSAIESEPVKGTLTGASGDSERRAGDTKGRGARECEMETEQIANFDNKGFFVQLRLCTSAIDTAVQPIAPLSVSIKKVLRPSIFSQILLQRRYGSADARRLAGELEKAIEQKLKDMKLSKLLSISALCIGPLPRLNLLIERWIRCEWEWSTRRQERRTGMEMRFPIRTARQITPSSSHHELRSIKYRSLS